MERAATTSHKHFRAAEHGFTLIEICIVVGILGVLAGISAPSMIQLRDNFRTKGVTADIAFMLRQGRALAIQENRPMALVVRTGSTTVATDDRVVLVRCPSGTTITTPALTGITTAMLDGTAAMPANFTIVRKADLGNGTSGLQPGSQGVLDIPLPHSKIIRTTGCSFCSGGNGIVLFESSGKIVLSNASSAASFTVSQQKFWPSPKAAHMYSVTLMTMTGEVRTWH
jgi:prepilin-type N-terminal cleavage/methylation domain-containing protein